MYSKTSKEQTQDEEEQQTEADAEFGDGDKERETSKINEEQKHKKNKEKRKDEAYEKAKEKFQDEDGSKLDKLIQMLYDLNKRVEADGYESPCNYDDTKGAPNDENEEEEISGDAWNKSHSYNSKK
ncbi:BnaA01g18370D [Brassica napus]|uniref:BnaA01g18370D protein n=1 Tax=Brassica napus TaxID=3708 RepID=A0A078GC26_BRANA|nr:BnaA01g18370D [Brassica napus]